MKKIIVLLTTILIQTIIFAQQEKQKTDLLEGITEEQYVPKVIIEAKWGKGPGEFGFIDGKGNEPSRGPNAIALDKDNNIYVLDAVNARIVKFDGNDKYLASIILEQRKIRIRTSNPSRLYAEKNPKAFKSMYNKFPEDFPEYEEREIDAINFLGLFQTIKIDQEGNIYYRPGIPQNPQCYALIIYNKDGKIIHAYTKEQIGEGSIYGLDPDNNGSLHFLIAGKAEPQYAIEINSEGEIKKNEWVKLDEKVKTEKFKNSLKVKKEIKDFSSLSPQSIEVINRNRSWYKTHETSGYDSYGNVYEIIWDEKNTNECAKVIKWQKTK